MIFTEYTDGNGERHHIWAGRALDGIRAAKQAGIRCFWCQGRKWEQTTSGKWIDDAYATLN